MLYTVVFTPDAEADLIELYDFIALKATPKIAAHFTDGIIDCCETLNTFPLRGRDCSDIRPGLRIVTYRNRVAIAFYVERERVNIIRILYRGRDYKAVLHEDSRTT